MSAGMQCDTCRRFAAPSAPGWLYVIRQPEASSSLASILGLPSNTADPATFCSAKCLAEWAYVQAVSAGPATGTETT